VNDLQGPGGLFRLHAPLPDFEARLIDAAHSRPVIEHTPEGLTLTYHD
jgi:hypothetical protein